jgi:hypothetical protein
MWDAIKKAASGMMEAGAALIRHGLAIEQILASPTPDIGLYNFRTYIFGIESEADFAHFRQAVANQIMAAQQALEQAQSTAYDSWGSSSEDRIAYLQAHIQAGEPAGANAQTQALQQRLAALGYMYQAMDMVWAEAQQAKPAAASPGPEPPA